MDLVVASAAVPVKMNVSVKGAMMNNGFIGNATVSNREHQTVVKGLLWLFLSFSMTANIILVVLLLLKSIVFDFQTPRYLWMLASARRFSEIELGLKNVSMLSCSAIKEDAGTNEEGAFVVPHGAQFYPASHKVYCCYSRFPPGRFCIHVGDDGFVEHVRFYGDDGKIGADGVRR